MKEEVKESPSLFAKATLYLVTLLNIYIYTCLSVVMMQIFGFPYEPLSESDLFLDGLVMAVPLFLPVAYVLFLMAIEKMTQRDSRIAMLRLYFVLIPTLALYCFAFMYININLASGGERLCSGEVVKKRRVRMKDGTSYRLVILCEETAGQVFKVERRVSKDAWSESYKGDLRPLTYVKGRLGVDLIVKKFSD